MATGNTRLAALLAWATLHDIDLDRADIDMDHLGAILVTFWHRRETPTQLANLTAVTGRLRRDTLPPVWFRGDAELPDGTKVEVIWAGAVAGPKEVITELVFHPFVDGTPGGEVLS